ncbi:hypothetical protein [Methylocaldum sp.]|uniref:hypothetical protein n=1 Tax=Methylocaldum sp. TaxID=1969727 RepID=UPI002D39E939|nr:hypothetical protein [Methylocaldum sp.]HYE38256.1 hypothetical protein [Methylocaldum sp.]
MSLTPSERAEFQRLRAKKNAPAREARKIARKAIGKQHRGRERDNGYLAYLRRQPCAARHLGGCAGPIDPAHIRYNDGPDRQNPGGARKNHDHHANPLCRAHHDEQHRGSERAFWDRVGKDAYATAAEHYAAYRGTTALSGAEAMEGEGRG